MSNRRNRNQTAARSPALLEPLEGRQLMSTVTPAIDVNGTATPLQLTYLKGTLPGSQLAGATISGRVQVRLSNPTTVDDKGANGVTVYASLDDVIDPATDRVLGTTTKNGNVRAGKSVNVNIPIKKQAAPLAGDYHILIGGVDAQQDALLTAEAPAISVQPATVTLVAQVGTPAPTALTAGKSFSIRATLSNTGNIDSKGPLSVAIGLSPDGAVVSLPLTTTTRNANVKANSKRGITYNFRVKVPVGTSVGSYFPAVTFSQGAADPIRVFSTTQITIGAR